MLFGDTYFIGDNGSELSVIQTTVFNGYIYAATANGVRRANILSKNLIDFNQWEIVAAGSWSGVEAFGTELIASDSSGSIYKYSNTSFVNTTSFNQSINDLRAVGDYLLITTPTIVYLYNLQLVLVRQILNSQLATIAPYLTCSSLSGTNLYIGTKDQGLLVTPIAISTTVENVTPSGPLRNSVFAFDVSLNSLWAVYGDYSGIYNPYPKDSYGISKYSKTKGWLHIPFEKVLNAKSLIRIIIDPNNESKVYCGSFDLGLLKVENDVATYLYTPVNSGLEAISGTNDTWVNGLIFDKSGNLWMNNSLIDNGIKVLKPNGIWDSFSTKSVITKPSSCALGRISIDKNGTKWLATSNSGIIGFNEKGTMLKKITEGIDAGNLPSIDGRVATVDNNNQLWIGTTRGLRVLSNVNDFLSDNQPTTTPIIILEDGVAQELLYEQFITDIVVDGANNKWIGTADSGLFLVSPDGQKTIYHFTTENSPLPSNSINDVAINGTTGEVLIATIKGMISFKGSATTASVDLSNAYVYPNPVRPGYQGTVKISGLIDKANVKITDIEGNLVHETTSEGGTIEWDTTAFGKYKVASGVYMIFISAEDGVETKVKKVMIIR
jgi:hypothetical protein